MDQNTDRGLDPDRIDLVGIGNAIVDLLAPAGAAELAAWRLEPGSMRLIDADVADRMTTALREAGRETLSSGGSAANTCVVAADLGVRVAYLGKVADDALGEVFRRDLEAAGVRFASRPAGAGQATGRCVVLVSEDGQRTMSTFLGAATSFDPGDVDETLIGGARFLYLEGYLFDPASAQAAFRAAARAAAAPGSTCRVAISLSDAFCVERHRDAFLEFVRSHAQIVFANEAELLALYRTDMATAVDRLATDVALGVVTRGAHGSLVVSGGERIEIAAVPTEIVDTTGAGDAYAAGFLAGLVRDLALAECGRMASEAASRIISHWGARPAR